VVNGLTIRWRSEYIIICSNIVIFIHRKHGLTLIGVLKVLYFLSPDLGALEVDDKRLRRFNFVGGSFTESVTVVQMTKIIFQSKYLTIYRF